MNNQKTCGDGNAENCPGCWQCFEDDEMKKSPTKNAPLKWSRSDDGNTVTKCGRFYIEALRYADDGALSCYELFEHDPYFAVEVRRGRFTLQRWAKAKAQRLAIEVKRV
jgi:hypothetical protein